ncbi:MAG: hypothetical protein SO412_01280, partial [Erysipelotrichaceae bacterium]|nr:hypothetical protein [Erysipelotrichaceae bacterium]
KYVVPDNTKCATVKNHQTEVILNKVYEDMQEHYGYVVLPARPKAPTDYIQKKIISNYLKITF